MAKAKDRTARASLSFALAIASAFGDSMELTVLGASSRYLVLLGAGTSYLVRDDETRLLMDCGNGTHLRLAHELGGVALSGVLVSHFHLDNVADLLPVAFALAPGTP